MGRKKKQSKPNPIKNDPNVSSTTEGGTPTTQFDTQESTNLKTAKQLAIYNSALSPIIIGDKNLATNKSASNDIDSNSDDLEWEEDIQDSIAPLSRSYLEAAKKAQTEDDIIIAQKIAKKEADATEAKKLLAQQHAEDMSKTITSAQNDIISESEIELSGNSPAQGWCSIS